MRKLVWILLLIAFGVGVVSAQDDISPHFAGAT